MNNSSLNRPAWTIPLAGEKTGIEIPGLAIAGGKGANLIRLVQAGFPVPDGFVITTKAYRLFVAGNSLEEPILAALPAHTSAGLSELDAASTRIRSLFTSGSLTDELSDCIIDEYKRLSEPAVAVRSSATAEDLPEMSFAGQQDTFLNVVGQENLIRAVVDCWSSLWTARAIGYRMRNRLSHTDVALAVVVQKMVESQTSGVLFTANPLTGSRTETVIDATFGLGEALVSGQVEPDHYVVDTTRRQILSKTLGAKSIAVHGQPGGGTLVVEAGMKDHQALPDEQILALADLGGQVAGKFGFPQDIEWAWADDRLWLLQSRPITSLFPVPEGLPPELLKVIFSFGAVQGMLDPITPLGRDSLRVLVATGASFFKVRVTPETQSVLYTAGERLWVNFTPLVRNTAGRRIIRKVLEFVEPSVGQALDAVWNDPRLQPERRGISLPGLLRISGFFLPLAGNLLLNLLAPQARREYILRNGEQVLEWMRKRCAAITGDRYDRLAQQARLLPELAQNYLPRTLILYISGVAAGMAAFNLVNILSKGLAPEPGEAFAHTEREEHAERKVHAERKERDGPDRVLELTRGLPHNPTTQMDLDLWKTAQVIRADPSSWQEFQTCTAAELAARYQAGELPPAAHHVVGRFLEKYGGRGLGEIDLGRARWSEDPAHVMDVLAGYLQIENGDQAPDVVFARGSDTAREAADRLVAALRATHSGWLKARLARFLISRIKELMGIRESPKFFMVRLMALLRRELLRTGEEFVQAGELEHPDDLMYLTFAELRALAAREQRDWQALIAQRREAYRHELLRRQIPRLLLSDGRAFYQGLREPAKTGGTLIGSPVSPGSVTGRVRVVFDPRRAQLLPGEILVCPGTDPSWTPLFLLAAGLVMEVGGMMTHGAVVAREYGIPAIVGVDQATSRLQTGQWISINGSTGMINLIEENPIKTERV